ncbi:MAG: porin [Leptothrix sp. (in: b-proteobacteria)]
MHSFSRHMIAAATLVVLGSTSAHAAGFKAGEWDLSVGGFINAFYTHTSCSGSSAITGLALGSSALGCGGKDSSTTIGNGLLPNGLVTTAKTHEGDWDLSATMMIGSAVASDSAIGNNNNVDVRQGFMTFGKKDFGTVKLGRDYGSFGLNAVLGDMTLIGVGAPVNATQANRVSLGHIGAGYTYPGHYGQITYTAPAAGDVTVSAGLYSPINGSATATAQSQPQLQAQVKWSAGGAAAWLGAKTQSFKASPDFTMSGVEVGGSLTLGGLGLLANLQSGKALGVLADADSGNVDQTNALIQATYAVTGSTKAGLSVGQSKLKNAVGAGLESNSSLTLGVYHNLTKSLTLTGEVSQTKSRSASGLEAKLDGVAVGGVLFF